MSVPTLRFEFVDELVELAPDDELTFGRQADVCIDTSRYLHRRLGLLRVQRGEWWLHNIGSAIALEIADQESPSSMTVAPGKAVPLPFDRSAVRFSAGKLDYEVLLSMARAGTGEIDLPTGPAGLEATITGSDVELNAEQRLLLVALAQLRLRDPAQPISALPTNQIVIHQLGWKRTKFNRKLDYLCEKLARVGVPGLIGEPGQQANRRRERLVDHAITVGLVTPDDLALLDTVG